VHSIELILDKLFCSIIKKKIQRLPNNLFTTNLISIPKTNECDSLFDSMIPDIRIRNTIYSSIINCELPKYKNPFYLCCLLGRETIFNCFKSYNPNTTQCIHAAIQANNLAIVKGLLCMNTDCTTPNEFGETPLMTACLKGSEPISLLLIEKMNSYEIKEEQQALSISCQKGLFKVAYELIKHGISNFWFTLTVHRCK